MEVRQIVHFRGSHIAVLADVTKLLDFLKRLPTAELLDDTSSGQEMEQEWPFYRQRLLCYGERKVTMSIVYDSVFRPLWEARGHVVSASTLEEAFVDSTDPRQRVQETICRIRVLLAKEAPEIAIVTAGEGYYLRVAA